MQFQENTKTVNEELVKFAEEHVLFGGYPRIVVENSEEKKQAFLGQIIKKNLPKLNPLERKKILDSLLEKRLTLPYKWIDFTNSAHPDSNPVPYVAKVNMFKISILFNIF